MASGRKRIQIDPPQKTPEDLDFSTPLKVSGDDWKTHSEWVQIGRVPKTFAISQGGKFHIQDTEGILDSYMQGPYQAWLASGLPF
jgi:hypothetical protein